MRRRTAAFSALLSVLLLASLITSASAKVARTPYSAFNFPAGWPQTGTECPGTPVSTPIIVCQVGGGSIDQLPNGRWIIRDLETLSIIYATSDGELSGYQLAKLNANLDAMANGPTTGTWTNYTAAGQETFAGTISGKFVTLDGNVRLSGHFMGLGAGKYAGLHITGDFFPEDQYIEVDGQEVAIGNVIGELKEPGVPAQGG